MIVPGGIELQKLPNPNAPCVNELGPLSRIKSPLLSSINQPEILTAAVGLAGSPTTSNSIQEAPEVPF